jgi:hypothetical protein
MVALAELVTARRVDVPAPLVDMGAARCRLALRHRVERWLANRSPGA